jgi:His-Xaa-Ser system radical SAM maturase HxsB
MEFQGGESSLTPKLVEYAIRRTKELNIKYKKTITYVLCTNLINIDAEIIELCKNNNVLISTSLDGPIYIHDINRGNNNSYKKVVEGIRIMREELGKDKVSALMTTSELSLKYPEEIIHSYIENGFSAIFLRALNPFGLASQNIDWERYNEEFFVFYKKSLEVIIEINKKGNLFIEEFTAILLRKILTPFSVGFVDLQSPSGIINNVIAYNYDGYVYASDESRMLAEVGDYTFRLGHCSDSYNQIFYGEKALNIATTWSNEALAGCSDCAFQAYCGADPVRNYSIHKDMEGHRPSSLFCKKMKNIFDHLFSLIIERPDELLPIFKQWIR